ncbi:hypothetical protein M569_02405 [Genlisea aurea]|uniref:LOB domain-containing protein n=1 Tax=Genlisea aurea TaxID=192259 RepID=S8CY86_9LAMI|nr:hypothetical protein M569_02405 [Genlisea aurea]
MRVSCNGCRVLRKGCSDDCSIRPCLEWIRTSDAQANATVFLAKFYGRAGLVNLINAGPPHLRPAIFRSLLYEACGRIVNPIYGSVGLLWSGSWNLCQEAVDAVLRGAPITKMACDMAESQNGPPLKAYDIRHVSKEDNLSGSNALNRVRFRRRFKRSTKRSRICAAAAEESIREEALRSPSHESSLSHQSTAELNVERRNRDSGCLSSSLDSSGLEFGQRDSNDGDIELNLTLGLEPKKRCVKAKVVASSASPSTEISAGICDVDLRLDFPAS